jgi:phosphatidylinositol 3-kinase
MKYYRHEDIPQPFYIKINRIIDPKRLLSIYDDKSSNISTFVSTVSIRTKKRSIFESPQLLVSIPSDSQIGTFSTPLTVQDLDLSMTLHLDIFSTTSSPSTPVSSTSLPLFGESSNKYNKSSCPQSWHLLRQGRYNLVLSSASGLLDEAFYSEVFSLTTNLEKYENKEFEKIDWIDEKSISMVNKRIVEICSECDLSLIEIELPKFSLPVRYEEIPYNEEARELNNLSASGFKIWIVPDFEVLNQRPNPMVEQFSRLDRVEAIDSKELRPDEETKEALSKIIALPDHKPLEESHGSTIWRYRYSLVQDKHALTKFLQAIRWQNSDEEEIAINLMKSWERIDKEDALHLLSNKFAANRHYSNQNSRGISEVRKYAVDVLSKCSPNEISSILLQLVQALRYEDFFDSPLKKLLINYAVENQEIAISLYWYLNVELEGTSQPTVTEEYQKIFNELVENLKQHSKNTFKTIESQKKLKNELLEISSQIKKSKRDTSNIEKKKQKLRSLIETSGLVNFNEKVPNFLDSSMMLTGILPEQSTVFMSKQYPIKLGFKLEGLSADYGLIFKNGDDLRQDQLIIQIIRLMDKLLKDVNLDMCLKPYNVLATSMKDGFVEFVQNSSTIYDRIQKKQSLGNYLKENQSNNSEIIDTFIKSCAGYCVITYLLGIGDRHLENLMVDNKGHLFHIDFGFILGKDPKPKPPPMKLCKEMVEAMGGEGSPGYNTFKTKCVEVFLQLRKHCKLIVNLFYLMIHSNLSGMQGDAIKVIDKLYDRFSFNQSSEEAEKFFLELINESVSALMPQIMEKIHVWANYWKRI